ncbi:MFS transporter [Streptomyces sp. NPDC048508]|uniref:MFS transporter n=1 Tax=Streptomyces sp. NPDC048508 TaxID=3365561 RepID=UPI0037103CAE
MCSDQGARDQDEGREGESAAWCCPDSRRSPACPPNALGAIGLLMPAPLAMVASFAVLSFGEGGVNATTIAYRQREIPSEFAGRVNTIIRTFVTGAIPISALALGATASHAGTGWTFAPATAACLAAVTLWWIGRNAPPPHPQQPDTDAPYETAR